ncbi:MAG: hypothetical protein NDI75_05915 [Candidatus Didemnitutus sp.]|nr:hypothetical protein [Candidatus Didemnitutus sp.]
MEHPIGKTLGTFHRVKASLASPEDRSLIHRQIALLEEIRDSLGVYGSMQHKMTSFEKLMSDPWMEDQKAFERLYAAWTELKESYAREIGAMTVNERLCHLGLMEEFDRSAGSPEALRSVLRSAFLTQEDIEAIVRSPKRE